MALRVRGAEAEEAAQRALARVGLDDREKERVSRLSGGEQQRVAWHASWSSNRIQCWPMKAEAVPEAPFPAVP